MHSTDDLIEEFICANIDDFEDTSSNTKSLFLNRKLGISLCPNIEELEDTITSNYNSSQVKVYSVKTNEIFIINSALIVQKLKDKIKEKIELKKQLKALTASTKEDCIKNKFIEIYIKEKDLSKLT